MSARHRRKILKRNQGRRAWRFAKTLGCYYFQRPVIDAAIAEAIPEMPMDMGTWGQL